ncbi:MAG: FAD-dependent oxidoreductase [Acidimicrobiaceae bacterium]|nr:FAD-dependent oxidoreductase [Acidimicrobiaceae bacterium]
MPQTSPTDPLVVLGAGPTGLAAARRAAQAGHRVVLLERADEVGGMAASPVVAGQRVDLGSHRLHPSTDPEILADLRDLLGAELQVRPRNGRIRLEGRWVAFPLRTVDLLRSVSPRFAVGAAVDAATSPLRRPRADTFGAHLRAGLGPTVSRAFYEPYATKLWGADADKLDASLARRRVSAGSPLAILRKLVRGARPEGRTFLYPAGGYGRICERLAESAVEAGVDLRLSTGATGLRPSPDGVAVEVGGSTIAAHRVLSTIPVSTVLGLLDPAPPDEVRLAMGRLEHRAMVLVYLVCDQDRYTPYDAHYLPSPDTPISRLSEPKNYRDGSDPGGRTVLCCEVPCRVGDNTWTASDDELGARMAESLVGQGLPRPRLVATETRRLPHVYPILRTGYADDLAATTHWLGGLERLVVLGRQGLYTPDNLHHVLRMGIAAADCLGADGSFDRTAWADALEEFKGFVVED